MSPSEKKVRYDFILRRLLDTHGADVDLEKLKKHASRLSGLSSRHHFVPQYFLEGFTGLDGLLSVYDKVHDRISPRRIAPKSIFFEPERHTINVDGLELSMIEDFLFSDIDTRLAPYINDLQNAPITDNLLSTDNQVNLSVFTIDLFWRNPATDNIAADLFQRSKIKWSDLVSDTVIEATERETIYKSDPVYKKLARFSMQGESMKRMSESHSNGYTHSKIWEFAKPAFVLGDFPIVFSSFPKTDSELKTLDRFLPMSSTRIYGEQRVMGTHFTRQDAILLNVMQIMLAKKAIVAADKILLEQAVGIFHTMKKDGTLDHLAKFIFSRQR